MSIYNYIVFLNNKKLKLYCYWFIKEIWEEEYGNRKNQVLIGIIIVVIGLFAFISEWINIPFIRKDNLFALFVATALLYYIILEKPWALVVGMIIGFWCFRYFP